MKLLTALIISIFTFTSCMAVAQSDESEIQLLISNAPVAEAAAAAEGEEMLIVVQWIRALAYSGRVQDAYAAAQKVKDKLHENHSIGSIADGLSMAGKTDEALATARKIKSDDRESAAMMSVMILFRAGRINEATPEARKIKDINEQGQVLAWISKKLASSGKLDEAAAVAGEIKGEFAASSLSEVQGEISIVLAKAGKGAEALTTARKIKDRTYRVMVIHTITEELAKAGKADAAKAASQEIEDENYRAQSLLNVIEAFADAGRIDEANAIVRKIKDDYLLALSLGKIAAGLNKAGKKGESQKTMNEALSAARGIKESLPRNKAISAISSDLARAGMISEAKNVIQECKDDNERAWAYDAIIEALAKEGRYNEAMPLALSIGEVYGQRSRAIAKIIEGLNAAGKPGQADTVKSPSNFSPEDQVAVVEGLAAAGKTEEAMVVARGIKKDKFRYTAFTYISQSLARSHSYRQARQAADLCPSPLTKLGEYFVILTTYAAEKNPDLKSRLEAESRNQ